MGKSSYIALLAVFVASNAALLADADTITMPAGIYDTRVDTESSSTRGFSTRSGGFTEDFESFAPGSLDGQQGWNAFSQDPDGTVEVGAFAGSPFNTQSVALSSNGFSSGNSSLTARAPEFGAVSVGRIGVDMAANGNFAAFDIIAPDTSFIVTRILFGASGNIMALADDPSTPNTGDFLNTTATWAANTSIRIEVEMFADGTFDVFKDGAVILEGSESIAFAREGALGFDRYQFRNFDAGGGLPSDAYFDNVEVQAGVIIPLPASGAFGSFGLVFLAIRRRRALTV